MGLAIPLRQFSYSFPSEYRVLINFAEEHNDDASLWQCWQIEVSGPFKMALAVKSGNAAVDSVQSRRVLALDEVMSIDTKILRDR